MAGPNGADDSYSKQFRKEVVEQAAKWTVGITAVVLGFAVTGWSLYLKKRVDDYYPGFPTDGIALFQQACPKDGWSDISTDPALAGAYIRLFDANALARGGSGEATITPANVPRMTLQTTNNHASSDNSLWSTSGPHGEDKLLSFMDRDAGHSGTARSPLDSLYVGVQNPAPLRIEPRYVQFHLCKKV